MATLWHWYWGGDVAREDDEGDFRASGDGTVWSASGFERAGGFPDWPAFAIAVRKQGAGAAGVSSRAAGQKEGADRPGKVCAGGVHAVSKEDEVPWRGGPRLR